jgi:hypothetical protein
MPTTVSFRVRVDLRTFVPESDLVGHEFPVTPYNDLTGEVWLATSAGQTVFVADQLVDVIGNLCFQAPTRLSAGEPFGAYIVSDDGEFFLETIGTDTRLYGRSVHPADRTSNAELVAPTAELLPALHDCGRRALAFFHRWLGTDPTKAELLAALDGLDQETTEALNDR